MKLKMNDGNIWKMMEHLISNCQVREQSNLNAARIRQAVKQEKNKQLQKLASTLQVQTLTKVNNTCNSNDINCSADISIFRGLMHNLSVISLNWESVICCNEKISELVHCPRVLLYLKGTQIKPTHIQ